MLAHDLSRTCSPDVGPDSDSQWYSWLFARDLLLAKLLQPTLQPQPVDMKLLEGGFDARMGSPSQYCLRWNNHRNSVLGTIDQLLQLKALTDVTLACEGGASLYAHRLVLAACSSYFQGLFVSMPPAQHPIVVLKDVRVCDMRALLEYMYRGEVNVEHDALQGLLRVAESLKVKGLVEELGNEANNARRPPSPPTMAPQHESPAPPRQPSSTTVDPRGAPHQDHQRSRPDPPTTTVPPPPPVTSHESQVRVSSPTPPLYALPPHVGLPPHRAPPHRLDHRQDHRDHRLDHRDHREMREQEFRESRDLRDLRDHLREHLRDHRGEQLQGHEPRDSHTPCSMDSDPPRPPLPALVPPVPPHHLSQCPDSPPLKRKRSMLADPMLSPTPILRTALGHTHGFPGADMSSLVSTLANTMIPLPGLLSSHVPQLLPHDHRDHENLYGLSMKKELIEEDTRSFSDISRDDDHEKLKLESLHNGPLLPDFTPYHMDPNGSSHYSNFVSYVPTPKPEWKRYKQYTKADLMEAIEAVKNGMTALQASRKYKVPSRTLYDKIKKMGINTVARRPPSKKPSPSSTDLERSTVDHHAPEEMRETSQERDSTTAESHLRDPVPARDPHPQDIHLEHEKRHTKSTSDEENHSTPGATIVEEKEESTTPTPTPTVGSFSLVGRQMYENGSGGGESSATPLDLTDTDSILSKRPEIEERA